MEITGVKRNLANPLLWALSIQALLLFSHLNLLDPWGDERYTELTVSESSREIISIVSRMNHPPLYFLLTHLWVHFSPGASLLVKIRAFSAVWTVISTIVLYYLWLWHESVRFQRFVLMLWILSPCLLLYGRMARSYSMQLALALIAIQAAIGWIESDSDWRAFSYFGISSGVLLYTHYLPGYAILGTTFLILISRRQFRKAIMSIVLVVVLLAPWLAVMRATVGGWLAMSAYQVGSFLADHTVRLGYWFISFSFGEMLSTAGTILAVVAAPVFAYLLWRGYQTRPYWMYFVLISSTIGYIAESRWAGYPFTASHVLFALPFFLMLLAKGCEKLARHQIPVLTLIIGLYLMGDYNYFAESGFLNKGYAMPNEAIVQTIREKSHGDPSLLVLDNPFPEPIIERLGRQTWITLLYDDETASIARQQIEAANQPVWFCRRAHDVSPDGFITRFEKELLQTHHTVRFEFVPYNILERWTLRWLRGPDQPAFAYRCLEIK